MAHRSNAPKPKKYGVSQQEKERRAQQWESYKQKYGNPPEYESDKDLINWYFPEDFQTKQPRVEEYYGKYGYLNPFGPSLTDQQKKQFIEEEKIYPIDRRQCQRGIMDNHPRHGGILTPDPDLNIYAPHQITNYERFLTQYLTQFQAYPFPKKSLSIDKIVELKKLPPPQIPPTLSQLENQIRKKFEEDVEKKKQSDIKSLEDNKAEIFTLTDKKAAEAKKMRLSYGFWVGCVAIGTAMYLIYKKKY